MEAAIGGEVCMNRHQLFLEGNGAGEGEKEGFARAILPNHKPNGSATLGNPFDVLNHRL
jgi:hypothetical protein